MHAWAALAVGLACLLSTPAAQPAPAVPQVVDCLLPGQVRKLGAMVTYLSARRPVRTTASDCEIRGGEYVLYDRADTGSALKVWLPQAEAGDKAAQAYVGEIYEKGMGLPPDYALAAVWYRRAAEQGDSRAQINLGHLYEKGLGVARDPAEALKWYRRATGLPGAVALDSGTVEAKPATETQPRRNERVTQPTTAPAAALFAGPSIELIEPPQLATRGATDIPVTPDSTREIVGQVTAPAGLLTLTVNDRKETPQANGLFHAQVQIGQQPLPLKLVAVDRQGKRAALELRLLPQTAAPPPDPRPVTPPVDFGRFFALVIGVDTYRDRQLAKLKSPVEDAKALAKILQSRYGFGVELLINPTRYQVISALAAYHQKLGDNDNFLLYFAGHGTLLEGGAIVRGQWLPSDAEKNNPANWISNVEITDHVSIFPAKQVLVIADSCYSGALTRSAMARIGADTSDKDRQHWLKLMATKRSRTVLTSGGLAPVLDSGSGKHSVFAQAMLDVLAVNTDVLETQHLYREVAARVAYAADRYRFEQVPEYAPIQHAGHEAGDFFFVPK
ncbi:MAG TPA: caspase family protein [Thiobacillus sp.]|nr:MAG: hypothetical protein B7Y50_00985 [Hydrogenophilales bacterium 28-61-11]OYZ56709.1 MAG: hypothetical protein B7Y21_10530 [Hydrogenophilales bacterium 16-61-112]OZA43416.1 MAG: hypothetical protein B7X81_11295 [Hydrogenophilales bacterium 17-61-76]HQT31597.1 caspase family protein [Thiobacillus sp.]HQT71058.1 caspase family protein [Thiobacillus sp.]